jgi:electron transfer flavoprotein alpha subunit
MTDYKGVMVFGETIEGKLASITTELLGGGRKLANELKEELSCLLVGDKVNELAKEAIAYGADKVYVVDNPQLKDYQTDTYTPILVEIIKEYSPRVLLFGQSTIGRDLAPRLAFKLQTGLSTDCIELNIDSTTKSLLQTRPVYGGNALATFTSDTFPQMATVRQKAMSPLERDDPKKGNVITHPAKIDLSKVKAKIIDKIKEEVAGIKLEDASIVVGGGRGIGGTEGFKQLEELAKLLKGAVGASRPPCDNNWVPTTVQIGLTGKIITPDLYIAVAVSGASQHLAGCSGSKTIVAINRDPEANIFKEARFGAVGDWKQILPAFTEKVKELVAG